MRIILINFFIFCYKNIYMKSSEYTNIIYEQMIHENNFLISEEYKQNSIS